MLVISAEGDPSTPAFRSLEIARLVPGARLAIVEGVGHYLQLERPDEFNQAVREFLSGHGLLPGSRLDVKGGGIMYQRDGMEFADILPTKLRAQADIGGYRVARQWPVQAYTTGFNGIRRHRPA